LFCSVNRTPGGISNRHLRDNGDSQRASRDAGKWTRHLAEMISCRTVEINSWAERLVQASHARHPASLMASASRTVDVAAYRAPLVDDRRNAKVSAEFWSTLHGSVPRRRCKSERAPYQKPERCPFQHLRIAVSIAGELQLETTYCPTAFSVFEDKNHFGGLQSLSPWPVSLSRARPGATRPKIPDHEIRVTRQLGLPPRYRHARIYLHSNIREMTAEPRRQTTNVAEDHDDARPHAADLVLKGPPRGRSASQLR
jgi:hypothetical protein